MFLSSRLDNIQPSPTLAVNALAQKLRAAGHDVISLGVGEPDLDTPDHVKQAAIDAMAQGRTKYTPVNGILELRQAISRKFKRDNGLDYRPEEITVGCGGKQVIYNAFLATLDVGDEVVIPAPCWVSYPDVVRLCGGNPIVVPCAAEQRFRLKPEQLERAITSRTKWLLLNSPNNPTGVAYSRDELRGLCDVLQRHPQVWILSDDIYEHMIYDNFIFATVAAADPRLKSRTLTVNGASKGYCMTGWRVGFGAGPVALINAMNALQSQITTHTASISQWATVAALDGPQEFILENRKIFQKRRDRVVAMLNDTQGLTCPKPEGAFYVFPNCAGLIGRRKPDGGVIATEADVVAYLLESAGVAVVPGAAFGLSPHFRLSYAASLSTLEEACQRISRACKALSQA